ncbi:tyrosine-type recombinase/integrase [Mesorhizobium sp.]|uniref:tyrosine-type recombinase/integrase n=1 Tax=Mesorhizobium sp. TaxID=1871066 RepID=UPI0026CA83CE
MKAYQPTDLGRPIVRFFQEYLPALRGMSCHTIRSYRDSMVLFLRFTTTDCGRPIEALMIDDITADRIVRFLACLESERRNSITTRNTRLAALILRQIPARREPGASGHPSASDRNPIQQGRPCGSDRIPGDRGDRGFLAGIDRKTPAGRRDYAMFSLMFNTGARVQEIVDLRVRDVRLEPPQSVGSGYQVVRREHPTQRTHHWEGLLASHPASQ